MLLFIKTSCVLYKTGILNLLHINKAENGISINVLILIFFRFIQLNIMYSRIGKEKVVKLINEVDETQSFLLQIPVETVEYVKYLEYIEQATGKVDEMEVELDYCKELYDIVEEFKINVPYEDLQDYLSLSVTLGNLRNLVDKKIEETTKIVAQFNSQMNKDISALISEVGVIKDECMVSFTIYLFLRLIYEGDFILATLVI